MNEFNRHRAMIAQVANALDSDVLEETVFLGWMLMSFERDHEFIETDCGNWYRLNG